MIHRDGRLVGENTDGQGFLTSLRTIIDPAGQDLVLFGAGGAARAIAVETALAGAASITVVNRGARRGEELVRLIGDKTRARAELVVWEKTYRVPATAAIVVNATSVGLFPRTDQRLDLDHDSLRPPMVVADVIPNPPSTQLIRPPEARGCTTLDGMGHAGQSGRDQHSPLDRRRCRCSRHAADAGRVVLSGRRLKPAAMSALQRAGVDLLCAPAETGR